MAMEEFDTEDFRRWSKDPRGKPFWDRLKVAREQALVDLRQRSRTGQPTAYQAGVLDQLDEFAQYVGLIVFEEVDARRLKEEEQSVETEA